MAEELEHMEAAEKARESFLATVAHFFVTHNEHINRGGKAFRLTQTRPKIVGTNVHLAHDGDPV